LKAERSYNYVSAAARFDHIGTFSLSWMNAGVTGIKGYDGNGAPTGNFDVTNNAFQLSYARMISTGLALGISGKYLQEDLADNDGYGVDAGLMFKPYDELQFGAMVRDLAAKHGKDDVPFEARLGVGVKPWQHLTMSMDLIKVKDVGGTAGIGAAYDVDINPNTNFYVAAGMNDLFHQQRGFTAGFGFNFQNFAIQYAYVTEPEEFLAQNHRLSVNFYFKDKNPIRSLFGSLHREAEKEEGCDKMCNRGPEGPKEFIHRYIFEGNPSLKLSLELLRPQQKDSIKSVWSEAGGVVSFPGVNFATGSAEINDEFARVLDGAAQLIKEHSEIQLLEIQGHTDNTGSDAINNPLSQARADAVRNYIISRGVAPDKLVAKGYGSSKPVATNATDSGKYQNRRIDIVRVR
jgi:outer membrane protein OmpA-like peptidoglycan-associated protein